MEKANNNKIEIKTIEYKQPTPEQLCKVFKLGNGIIEIEVPQIRNKPHRSSWRKYSKYEMVNIEDGEIRTTNQATNRAESNASRFKKQKKYLYRIILNNYTGADNERIIILTFEDKVFDIDVCYKAVKNFRSKLERRIKQKLNFIIVTLFKSKNKLSYELWVKVPDISTLEIDNRMLQKIWDKGKVECLKITDISKQANYMKSNNDYFPPYCKLYRTSVKGIEKPIPEILPYAEAKVLCKNMEQTYATTKLVCKTSESGIEYAVNKITYETYTAKQNIKEGGEKTMEYYIEKNEKKKEEILEKIKTFSDYKDVGNWIKLDYISKDLQWFITKVSRMIEYGASDEAIQTFIETDIGNILANIDITSNFNLYVVSSLKAIQLIVDTLEYLKELFGQVQFSQDDKQKIESMFEMAINIAKSTDIYNASMTPKNI